MLMAGIVGRTAAVSQLRYQGMPTMAPRPPDDPNAPGFADQLKPYLAGFA
jgi:hypothetical protein